MQPNRPGAAGLPPASSRSAATNRPASRWNANTATGRRCRDLFRGYMRALGEPTAPGGRERTGVILHQWGAGRKQFGTEGLGF